VDTELKYLLKGKWEYNISDGKLFCKNKSGVMYVFENKDNLFFQDVLTALKHGKANPDLEIKYKQPEVNIPLELFHRILRSNEVIFEQLVGLKQGADGLYCFSEYTKDFRLNHNKYEDEKIVYIDPQRMCKITRRIRNRERIHARLRIEDSKIILECEFPWTIMTIIIPTVRRDMGL